MKVLTFLALTAVYLTAFFVYSAPSTTERNEEELSNSTLSSYMGSPSPSSGSFRATRKPIPEHCMYRLKHEEKVHKAIKKCEEKTGFMTQGNESFIDMLERDDFDDKCFGSCLLDKLDISKNDGGKKLKKFQNDFAKFFKSNATVSIEEQRIKGWKSCATSLENEIKSKDLKKPVYCKSAFKFVACGTRVEEMAHRSCREQ